MAEVYSGELSIDKEPISFGSIKIPIVKGEPGEGRNLEFTWDGTSLGVRLEGEEGYQYVDLKGEKGEQGIQGEKGETGEKGVSGVAFQKEEPVDDEIVIWVDEDDDSGSVFTEEDMKNIVAAMFPVLTQAEYDELVANGAVNKDLYYCIKEE